MLLILSQFAYSQQQKEKPSLENFQRKYRYVKNKSYTGPETKYISPSAIKEEENPPQINSSTPSNGGNIDYSPEELERIRKRKAQQHESDRLGSGQGSGQENGYGEGGNKSKNPKMGVPEPIEFDPPEINPPDINLPDLDVNPPTFSSGFWKVLLIVIGAILILIIIYYIFKNQRPSNRKVKTQTQEFDWNPELITKSELQLRLEQAMLENDYRACVRIYFTFIMKEMIRLRYIRWKKEYTNYDYILQAKSKPYHSEFEETVRIYDLVWYGEYNIGQSEYQLLEKHLELNYQLLNKKDV